MSTILSKMRWFKCLILCVGHLIVHLSLAFIQVSDETMKEESKNFLKWFAIIMGSGCLSIGFFSYLLVLPVMTCLKKSKLKTHFMVLFVTSCYFANLSVMLWGLQHVLIQSTVNQCYAVSGHIGLVFGLLVLYDNMKGESTKELYERVLDELDDELELGTVSNKIGIDDDDVQRVRD